MSNNAAENRRYISKRKLIENVFFGLLGILFTVLVAGGVAEYPSFIADNIVAVSVGGITGMLAFYLIEVTTVGRTLETAFRESRPLTAVVLLGLLLAVVGGVRLIENSNSEIGVAWLIGFSVIVPTVSVLSYLRGRGSAADLDFS